VGQLKGDIMKTRRNFIPVLVLFYLLCFSVTGNAQYVLKNSGFSNGGQVMTDSTSYYMLGITGQSLTGQGENEEYASMAGFLFQAVDLATGLENPFGIVPLQFYLYQNFPNPFNPRTTIRFDLPKTSRVKIILHNILGQRVLTILDEHRQPGKHSVKLDAGSLASGMYFYTIEAGPYFAVCKMVLLK